MHDQIMKLCDELVWASDPDDPYPVSEQLQETIADRLERVREHAQDVLLTGLVVDLESGIAGTAGQQEPDNSSSRQSSA